MVAVLKRSIAAVVFDAKQSSSASSVIRCGTSCPNRPDYWRVSPFCPRHAKPRLAIVLITSIHTSKGTDMGQQSAVLQRQAPLRAAYKEHPEQALILKRAWTVFEAGQDAFYGGVVPGEPYPGSSQLGTHPPGGGSYHTPQPRA